MGYGEYPSARELGLDEEAARSLLRQAKWAAEFLLGYPVVERRVQEVVLPHAGIQRLHEWPIRDIQVDFTGWDGEVNEQLGWVRKIAVPSTEVRIHYTVGYGKDVPAVVKQLVMLLARAKLGLEVDLQELNELVETGRWMRKCAEEERNRG